MSDEYYPAQIREPGQLLNMVSKFDSKILWIGYLPEFRKNSISAFVIQPDGSYDLLINPRAIPILSNGKIAYVFTGAKVISSFSFKGGGKKYFQENNTRNEKGIMLTWDHYGNMLFKLSYKRSWNSNMQCFEHNFGQTSLFLDKISVAYLKRNRIKYLKERRKKE